MVTVAGYETNQTLHQTDLSVSADFIHQACYQQAQLTLGLLIQL